MKKRYRVCAQNCGHRYNYQEFTSYTAAAKYAAALLKDGCKQVVIEVL